jgi:hypothetical protein
LHSIEKGTAALTDIVGDGMLRSIARRLGRTVAPQAQGTPIRGVLAITIGIAAISLPFVALPTMLVILGGYFLVDGVLCLLGLWRASGRTGCWCSCRCLRSSQAARACWHRTRPSSVS